MTAIRMATWNIDGLTPNKYDAQSLMIQHNLDVLLISEAHCTDSTYVKFQNYECYVTQHPDETGHAGAAIIVRKSLNHHVMPEYRTCEIQATTIAVEDKYGCFNISSVYCPPKHKVSKEMFTRFFETLGNRFLVGGDWNCKNTYWGSRLTNTRGRQLKLSLDANNLFTASTCEPTHFPPVISKIPDLIDFFVIKGFSSHYVKCEPCYDTSSAHSPVLLTLSTKIIEHDSPARLYNKKTDWFSFREYVEENIELKTALKTPEDMDTATKYLTNLIQEACWHSTPILDTKERIHNYLLK